MPRFSRFVPDPFVLALLATVLVASVAPARPPAQGWFALATQLSVAALFFLHGVKLPAQAMLAGLRHWRLHALILAGTFVVFPLAGWLLRPLLEPLVTPPLYLGVLFLCLLPSTVQSSIALTSIARGNVPAAVCSASASSMLGMLLTPLLASWLLGTTGTAAASPGLDAFGRIGLQLLLPFVLGQLAQPWLGDAVRRHARMARLVDQGSILLVVYTAFGAAVIQGLWQRVSWPALAGLVGVCALLLLVVLGTLTLLSRRLGLGPEDEIAIVFCGATKSLASGVPIANVLFPASIAGPIVLPVMLYHQLQLMACSALAQRYAKRQATTEAMASAT